MKVSLIKRDKAQSIELQVNRVYCIGYAGRNQAKVREHIDELARIGVTAPPRTPTVYPVSTYLLTDAPRIMAQGKETSGEVEFVLFLHGDKTYVSVGSDQTDRDLEKVSIVKSKQMCEKAVANQVWDYADIRDHWDSLILRAWVTDEKGKRIYQDGSATALLPVPDLIDAVKRETDRSLDDSVIFSGTVPTHEGFVFAKTWDLELEDPILKRKITHRYEVTSLEQEMKV
jgi:hypothetical protein